MGKIADAIRGSALPEQNRKKLLALDREFVEMEMEIQTLKTQNLNLQAKVNPLEREIDGLKNQIKQEPAREFTEAGGVLFKRTPRGGYSDIPYCPTCHSAMFHLSGPLPYTCGNQACRQMASFSKRDLAKIMSMLPK
jgi:hypothetical protein